MRGKHHSREQVQRRKDVVYAAILTAVLAGFALLVLWIQGVAHDLRTANEARDALARQVQQLGGTPVAGSPGSRGEVGPTGPAGVNGTDGQPGTDGRDGSPGPTGPAGVNGTDGSDGLPGPVGPTGAAGPTGPAGTDGKDGADGADGRDGQTCPDGYSLQAPKWDEDALVCRKDETPDPGPVSVQVAGILDRRRF